MPVLRGLRISVHLYNFLESNGFTVAFVLGHFVCLSFVRLNIYRVYFVRLFFADFN